MAVFTDHVPAQARQTFSADAGAHEKPEAPGLTLKSRLLPSQRVSAAIPHHVCLRLVGAWIGAVALLLAVVLVLRWSA